MFARFVLMCFPSMSVLVFVFQSLMNPNLNCLLISQLKSVSISWFVLISLCYRIHFIIVLLRFHSIKLFLYNVFVTIWLHKGITPTMKLLHQLWRACGLYKTLVVFMYRTINNMSDNMTTQNSHWFFLIFFFKGKCYFSLCHSPQLFMSFSFAKHSPFNSSN